MPYRSWDADTGGILGALILAPVTSLLSRRHLLQLYGIHSLPRSDVACDINNRSWHMQSVPLQSHIFAVRFNGLNPHTAIRSLSLSFSLSLSLSHTHIYTRLRGQTGRQMPLQPLLPGQKCYEPLGAIRGVIDVTLGSSAGSIDGRPMACTRMYHGSARDRDFVQYWLQ